MRNFLFSGFLVLFMALLAINFPSISSMVEAQAPAPCITNMSICDFRVANRKLWTDHVTWTRMFIVSDLAGLKDTTYVVNRLLRNQQDIGNSIKPFYGEEAGNKLTSLLKQHILLAANLVKYAKEGNSAQLAVEEKKWYANADEIATFLSTANPNIPKKEITDMLYKHLRVTKQEVVYRLNENYAEDIAAYDTIFEDILNMSDVIAYAIVKQFPDKFQK